MFAELKRRNIFRVAAVYAVTGWITLQVISVITPALKLPDWVDSFIAIVFIAGFPLALLLAWAFEVTPEGMKRTEAVADGESIRPQTGRKMDFAILGGLALVVVLIIGNRVLPKAGPPIESIAEAPVSAATAPETAQIGISIAVLPFVDMSADGDQEYFSDGMSDEILNALVKVPDLRVIGRTSSFSFKGQNIDIREIGKALNVSHILEGSVRKQGNAVRITAQLIDAKDGVHLWSEKYDGTLEDIFALQDQISHAIATELKIKLNVGAPVRLVTALTDNPQAYDLYLRGRQLSYVQWGEDTLTNAIDFFEQAVALDPNFVEAWEQLAYAAWRVPLNIPVKDHAHYVALSENAANRALALRPASAALNDTLSQLEMINKKYAEGVRLLESGQLEDEDGNLAYRYGYSYLTIGRTQEALAYFERAVELDPMQARAIGFQAIAQLQLGQFEQAERTAKRAYDLGFTVSAFTVAEAKYMQGDRQGAIDFVVQAYDATSYFFPQFSNRDEFIFVINILYGNDKAAQKRLLGAMDQATDPNYPVDSSVLGGWRIGGQADKFIAEIDAHISPTIPLNLTGIWGEDAGGRKIRQHPKFAKWADKVGLVTAWQEFGWPDKCTPNPGSDGTGGKFTCS